MKIQIQKHTIKHFFLERFTMYKSRDRVLLSEKEKFDERRDLKKGESSFEKVIEQSL